MALGRKAIFFSLGAMLVLGMVFVAISTTSLSTSRATQAQVEALKINLDSVRDTQLPVLLDAASRRTVQRIAEQAAQDPFASEEAVKSAFRTCMLQQCDQRAEPIAGSLDRLEALFENNTRYDVELELRDVQLSQLGPFTLYVSADFHVSLQDDVTRARVDKNLSVGRQISTRGLLDPHATRMFGVPYQVRPSAIGDGGPAVVWTHSINGGYVADDRSPSYLGRLTQNPQASEHGIFTLAAPGSRGTGDSYIDWQTDQDSDVVLVPRPEAIHWEDSQAKIQLSEYYAFRYRLFED